MSTTEQKVTNFLLLLWCSVLLLIVDDYALELLIDLDPPALLLP